MQLKKLPVGLSSFVKLREQNCVYIDKTRFIYDLVTTGDYYFLSRPRRFGKSLLVSTLHELFKANRKLFDGLWIDSSDYQWREHPIIHVDFGSIAHGDTRVFEQDIIERLHEIAQDFDVKIARGTTIAKTVRVLVSTLAKMAPVVVLVDEYDKPVLDNIADTNEAVARREVLREFYSTLKACDEYLRFVFLTGITKFTQTSLFSGLNNLVDISMSARYATMLGYTEDEVRQSFGAYIERLAKVQFVSTDKVIEILRERYNGYAFEHDVERVYNPYSVLQSLSERAFKDYWLATGTPTFLIDLLETRDDYDLSKIERPTVSERSMTTFDIKDIPLAPLLFQTGYLTVESYDSQNRLYTLYFPNKEVAEAMSLLLARSFGRVEEDRAVIFARDIGNALKHADWFAFQVALQELFNKMPYTTHIKCERDLQFILYAVCKLIGIQIDPEVATNLGRADLVVLSHNQIFIIELKVDKTAHAALKQIEDRRYYEKYVDASKKIMLVGINFESKTKRVTVEILAVNNLTGNANG